MKIAIVGIGGVGGAVGAALADKYPQETFFVARGENKRIIAENGLTLKSVKLGELNAKPALVTDDPSTIGAVDVIFLTSKGYALIDACTQITPMITSQTIVIPLLNGVMVSEMMEPFLPQCVVADGTIHIFSSLVSPGVVEQTAGFYSIKFGMKDGSRPVLFNALAERLNACGIEAEVSEQIMADSWMKFVNMCGNSVILCHYGGPAGFVREHADWKDVGYAVLRELIAVAQAKGVTLPADLDTHLIAQFGDLPPQSMSSLFRDLNSGKPAKETELFHIVGRLADLADATGIAVPYHKEALEKYAGQ